MQKATNEWYSGVREASSDEEEIMEDDEQLYQQQRDHSEPINSNSTETTELWWNCITCSSGICQDNVVGSIKPKDHMYIFFDL